jgi:acetyl-CoA acyltransferase 2
LPECRNLTHAFQLILSKGASGFTDCLLWAIFSISGALLALGIFLVRKLMTDTIVFVAAKRTPFGAFGGALKNQTATDLAVQASKACLEQIPIDREEFDHVLFGNVASTSCDGIYLARHVGLRSGLPQKVPAVTLNRLCGSGFESIIQGARLIQTGEATTVLVGGTESMSQSPYVLRGARFGYRLGHSELEDSLVSGLFDTIPQMPMALTAENLAVKYSISRQACDEFALTSQRKTAEGVANGAFANELCPVRFLEKGSERVFEKDEHPRPEASMEGLQKLKPVFKKDGVVTAGNASGMVDGAAALILTSQSNATKKGWKVLGRLRASHSVGCDPAIMGIGPVPAVRGLFAKTGLNLAQMNLVEVNEAFAAQTLAVAKELGLDEGTLNVDGGAIAIGHPLGASGARITTHLLYALAKRGGGLGLGTACIGGGQGIAVIVEV